MQLTIGSLAAIAGLVITFAQDHSAFLGLLVFGVWALTSALAVLAVLFLYRTKLLGAWRVSAWAATAVAGVIAISIPATPQAFALLTGIWALLFGVIQIVSLFAGNGYRAKSGEGFFVAGASLILGALQLLMPINSVVNVGVLGAFWIVIGSWLIIGALSPNVSTIQGSST